MHWFHELFVNCLHLHTSVLGTENLENMPQLQQQ